MTLLPLVPGIRPSLREDAGKPDAAHVKSLTEQTLKRDNHTCRFCGFKSLRYQRAIPWPADKDTGFVTSCTFCEQVVALERTGITGPGILVWLPEIGQAELNHIARAIYIARANKDQHAEAAANVQALANRAFDALAARRGEAKKRLGTDDPLLLATALQEALDDKERGGAAKKIDGIRLLPAEKHMMRGKQGDVNYFPDMVRYWTSAEGPFGKQPVESWAALFKDAEARAGHA